MNGFSPVNDAAEWAVKFASDFNGRITRNAEQHAGMLQAVEMHRRTHAKPRKNLTVFPLNIRSLSG